MPDRRSLPLDTHTTCPGCNLPVIAGIEYEGALWHEDCAARAIVRDADSRAGIGKPTVEDSLWALFESEQGQELSSTVLLGGGVLFNVVFPLILGAIGGGAIGAGIGFFAVLFIFQDSPWFLGAVLVPALVGSVIGVFLGFKGLALFLAEAVMDGFEKQLIRRLRRMQARSRGVRPPP